MSKYTTELRLICETEIGIDIPLGYNHVDKVIELARPKIFDFDYPIFDENYKSVIETKFIKHYYMREICAETYGRWKLFLNDKMNIIMPYYNSLYKSALLKFDPLHDVDLTISRNKNTMGNNSGNTNTEQQINNKQNTDRNINTDTTNAFNGKETERFSDTPQGGLNDIENNGYLTNATITDTDNTENRNTTTTENTNNTGNSETNTNTNTSGSYKDTEEYIETLKGKNVGSSFSKLLLEYRETLINIDEQILDDLGDLFIDLW